MTIQSHQISIETKYWNFARRDETSKDMQLRMAKPTYKRPWLTHHKVNDFRQPMIFELLKNSPQALHDLLQKARITALESARAPYFKLRYMR